MPRPLIAVTCSTRYAMPWGEYSRHHRQDYVPEEYTAALEISGGLPLCLPVLEKPETIAAILERVDGLLLTGGPDINPRFFDQEPRSGLGEVDTSLDFMELEAAKKALEMGLPILGICRGIQILTAASGGGLIQDIPTETENTLSHNMHADKSVLFHKVAVEPGTLLHRILETDELWVNSKHHQAVADPPAGFRVSARASDGLVEAMEKTDHPFQLGVQWHPEGTFRKDEPSRKIFGAFVAALQARG